MLNKSVFLLEDNYCIILEVTVHGLQLSVHSWKKQKVEENYVVISWNQFLKCFNCCIIH